MMMILKMGWEFGAAKTISRKKMQVGCLFHDNIFKFQFLYFAVSLLDGYSKTQRHFRSE